MYHRLGAETTDPLEDLLKQQTSDAGYFDRPMAGEALRRDNENFAYALFEIMPLAEKATMYAKLGVRYNPDPRLMQLLAAMQYALPANYMNISLRNEMIRASLAEELAKGTAAGSIGHVGSMFSEFLDRVGGSFTKFFQRVGHEFGAGLRQIGHNVLSFRDAMIKLGGPAMRYVTDFLILTPGVVFIFGNLSAELGGAIVEARRVQLTPIAAGYSQYLGDMSLILNTTSPYLPPPWNVVAKVVAAVYKAGAALINWQIAMHYQDLLEHAEEANAKAREEMESALRQSFRDIEDELHEAGFMTQSVGGENTVANPSGGMAPGGMVLLGLAGLAAAVVLFWK